MDGLLGKAEKALNRQQKATPAKRRAVTIMIIALLLAAIGGAALSQIKPQDTVRLATKPMTEQYIIGAMLKEVIEDNTDLRVELIQGVGGGTSNIMPAWKAANSICIPSILPPAGTWCSVTKAFIRKRSMISSSRNTPKRTACSGPPSSASMIPTAWLCAAKSRSVTICATYSDLRSVAGQLTFGGEYDFFERPDGYDGLCALYGLDFRKTMDLDIGLKYQAINEGKVDVMDIFTTDGQLAAADVVVLEDDRQYFSSAMAALVVRDEVLDRYPQLEDALAKLENVLDDEQMAQLNYQVESGGQEAEQAAHDFLLHKQLIEEE